MKGADRQLEPLQNVHAPVHYTLRAIGTSVLSQALQNVRQLRLAVADPCRANWSADFDKSPQVIPRRYNYHPGVLYERGWEVPDVPLVEHADRPADRHHNEATCPCDIKHDIPDRTTAEVREHQPGAEIVEPVHLGVPIGCREVGPGVAEVCDERIERIANLGPVAADGITVPETL